MSNKSKNKPNEYKIYYIGTALEGIMVITHLGPQAAVDLVRTETGNTKPLEVYEMTFLGEFKGKKSNKKLSFQFGDYKFYTNPKSKSKK